MKRRKTARWLMPLGVALFISAACSTSAASDAEPTVGATPTAAAAPTPAKTSTPIPTAETPTSLPTETPVPTSPPTVTSVPAAPTATPVDEARAEAGLFFNTFGFTTDFSIHSVPFQEVSWGGQPKDGIPAVDRPKYQSVADADQWLEDSEPVLRLDIEGDVRAYPIQILIWHEIVNDVVGGIPVSVSYCPLCSTAIVFDTTLADGRVLDFGTTGNLRNSDLVMYDRQTESWWQQITGEAIIGELTGTKLDFIPSPLVSWKDFKEADPSGQVLSRDTGFNRAYGWQPYVLYDSSDPFLFDGEVDERLRATERVATVSLDEIDVAFPFSVLENEPVVHFDLDGQDIVVFFKKGTASALDANTIAGGRDVGSTAVYEAAADGQALTFRAEGDVFIDNETGSTWTLLGESIGGPLNGETLKPVVHHNHLWFAWAVFKPDTILYRGAGA